MTLPSKRVLASAIGAAAVVMIAVTLVGADRQIESQVTAAIQSRERT